VQVRDWGVGRVVGRILRGELAGFTQVSKAGALSLSKKKKKEIDKPTKPKFAWEWGWDGMVEGAPFSPRKA
jgi:hypothetical protein